MTKEEIETAMLDAGLINPIARPHKAMDKTHHFILYCGERDARRTEQVPRGANNKAAVMEAIAKLNAS